MTVHPVPDAALDADIATVAQKGAGKTYANRGLVERLLDQRRRVVVLDPLNSWWGLKALANGKAGYPVAVIGGPNGDIALDPQAGERLAAFVASSEISVVVDVSELKRGEMIRFSTDFLAALYRLNRNPLWLVLEEADVFAPQQPMGDATILLHHVDQIARRGRARGFRLWSITQRPAKLHKDILTQTSTLIMLRIRSPQDRAAAEAWIVGNAEAPQAREIVASLASLPVGEGWIWSPDHDLLARVKFPPIRTLDTSATPQAGEERRSVGKLAQVDLGALREALKPAEAPPVPALVAKAAVADLRAAEERGYQRGLVAGRRKGLKDAYVKLDGLIPTLLAQLWTEAEGGDEPASVVRASPPDRPLASPPPPPRKPAPHPHVPADGAITGPQQKILNALAWWRAFGIAEPTNEQIGFVAGYAPGSGNFNNLRGGLRAAGLIDYPAGGRVALTATGASAAVAPDLAVTTEAFHTQVRAKLNGPQVRLLDPILTTYPRSLSTDELAAAAGYAPGSGNFNNLRGSLRSIGLIDYPAAGQVRAADWLFPERS